MINCHSNFDPNNKEPYGKKRALVRANMLTQVKYQQIGLLLQHEQDYPGSSQGFPIQQLVIFGIPLYLKMYLKLSLIEFLFSSHRIRVSWFQLQRSSNSGPRGRWDDRGRRSLLLVFASKHKVHVVARKRDLGSSAQE